jgi:hypothetical protein
MCKAKSMRNFVVKDKIGVAVDVVGRIIVGMLGFGVAAAAFAQGHVGIAAGAALLITVMLVPTAKVSALTWNVRWLIAFVLFVALVSMTPEML